MKGEEIEDKEVSIKLFQEQYIFPKYNVLEFSVFAYKWPILDDHEVYNGRNPSVKNTRVKELLQKLEGLSPIKKGFELRTMVS